MAVLKISMRPLPSEFIGLALQLPVRARARVHVDVRRRWSLVEKPVVGQLEDDCRPCF